VSSDHLVESETQPVRVLARLRVGKNPESQARGRGEMAADYLIDLVCQSNQLLVVEVKWR